MNKQILTYIAKNLFYVLFCEAVYFHFYIELFYINVKTVYCIQRAFRCILRVNFALMHLCFANIVINVAFDLIHFIFMVIEIRIRIYISCFFLSHILFSFTLKKILSMSSYENRFLIKVCWMAVKYVYEFLFQKVI